jgi:hypothetical protein
MASRAPAYDATPLDVLLASVPSLPRAILSRLTARMILCLDELAGDTDLNSKMDCRRGFRAMDLGQLGGAVGSNQ